MAELQERIGYGEFVEWRVFYELEPWGEERADMLAAMQMSLLANVNRNPKKRKKAFTVLDFLPDWWNERASPKRLEAKMRGIASQIKTPAHDGEDNERGRT